MREEGVDPHPCERVSHVVVQLGWNVCELGGARRLVRCGHEALVLAGQERLEGDGPAWRLS